MHVKFLSLLAVALSLGAAPVASAADQPMRAPVYKAPVAAPVYSWTGFYVGGNAGFGWGDANDAMRLGGSWLIPGSDLTDNRLLTPLGNGQLKPDGFTGGAQAGYNYQTGQWVFGIEADINYLGLRDSFSAGVINTVFGNRYTFASSFESSWLATARPRIGYAFDRFLVYATGGLAIANQKFSQTIIQLNVPFVEAGSVSDTAVGWTVGAGAEYALNNRWSLKAEYLYVDPGSVSFATRGACTGGVVGCDLYTGTHSADLKANIVRAGVNYHFD